MSRARSGSAARLTLPSMTLEQEGRVLIAWLTLPAPHFVTTTVLADLDRLTAAVDRDPGVGAVVLASATEGRWLTHADADELGAMAELPLPTIPLGVLRVFWRIVDRLLRLPGSAAVAELLGPMGVGLLWGHRWKRTILRMNRSSAVYLAAIGGPALGGGHEIALACDLRYVADTPQVQLGQIETLAGLIPGGGGTQRLPRLIGTARALELVLDGGPVDARRAHELGLVHRVVAPDALLVEAHETATRLARRSPTAIRLAKRCLHEATDRPLARGLDHELAAFLASGNTPYTRNAFRAFAADRHALGDSPFVADLTPWHDGTRFDQPSAPGRDVTAPPRGRSASSGSDR